MPHPPRTGDYALCFASPSVPPGCRARPLRHEIGAGEVADGGNGVDLDLEVGLAVSVGIALDQPVAACGVERGAQLAGMAAERVLVDEGEGLVAPLGGVGVDPLEVDAVAALGE